MSLVIVLFLLANVAYSIVLPLNVLEESNTIALVRYPLLICPNPFSTTLTQQLKSIGLWTEGLWTQGRALLYLYRFAVMPRSFECQDIYSGPIDPSSSKTEISTCVPGDYKSFYE